MLKAYDKVHWDFLENLLRKMGFADHFVRIIMQCVITVSYSIIINGQPTTSFKPYGGLRQGDPLSPYLFILITNALFYALDKSLNDKLISS